MKRLHLGSSDTIVSEFCLGTMYFGTRVSRANAFRVMDCYRDYGGNFIDTANNYAWGVGDTYYLDLCYIHTDQLEYVLDERLEALGLLVKQGKIRYKGCSNISTQRYLKSEAINRDRGWGQFQAVQQKFSYLLPETIDPEAAMKFVDQRLIDAAEQHGVSLLSYSVLLSGAYAKGFRSLPIEYQTEKNFKAYSRLDMAAKYLGCSRSQFVLLWVRQRSEHMIPIIAAGNTGQLRENLKALEFEGEASLLQDLVNVKAS